MTITTIQQLNNNFQDAASRGAVEGAGAFMQIYKLIKDQAIGEISRSEAFRQASRFTDVSNKDQSASLQIARLELGLQ